MEFLQLIFSAGWWHAFKVVCNYGAPIICAIGLAWYIYDRVTGGI